MPKEHSESHRFEWEQGSAKNKIKRIFPSTHTLFAPTVFDFPQKVQPASKRYQTISDEKLQKLQFLSNWWARELSGTEKQPTLWYILLKPCEV